MPSFTALIIAFLYAPLLILVIYSFNASRMTTVWAGFSLQWFVQVAHNGDIRGAALNSLIIAVAATIASTAIATAAALALERGVMPFGRGLVTGMIAMPLVVPEIIVAITTLVFFSALGMHYGLLNLIIAHTVFCIPFAVLPIRARLLDMGGTLEEAGRDLYADEWQLFRRITLPLLMPAIGAGAIMAFVVSLDDFLISMMVSSAGSTTLAGLCLRHDAPGRDARGERHLHHSARRLADLRHRSASARPALSADGLIRRDQHQRRTE